MVKNKSFGQLMEEGRSPSFFKILRRGDLSSELNRMIPNHLLRSISIESFSYKMVFKVSWGSSWIVKLSKNPRFYYMEDCGWNKFVDDNGLGDNEYLTFTHEGNMCFKVIIFQADGEEMLRPRRPLPIASSSGGNKREGKRIISIEVKEEQEIESLSESSYSGLKTAKCACGRLKQKRKISLGKKKAEKAVNSKRKKRNVETAYNDSEDNCLSLGPEFSITITTSYLVYLGVPKKFADMHMPKETTRLKIRDEEGSKSWDVTYRRLGTEARFNAGWAGLARDLGLEKGDVCKFTLIKPMEMLVKVLSKATP